MLFYYAPLAASCVSDDSCCAPVVSCQLLASVQRQLIAICSVWLMVLFPSTYSIRFAVRNVERVPRHPILHRLPSSLIAGSVSVYCYCHASSFDAACYPSTKASSPCASAAACQRHSMPRQLLRVVDMFLPLLRLQFSFAGPPERAGCCFSVRFEHGLGPRAAKEGAIEALKTVDMRRFNSLDFKRLAVARRRGLPKSNMGKVFHGSESESACAFALAGWGIWQGCPRKRLESECLSRRPGHLQCSQRVLSEASVQRAGTMPAACTNHRRALCEPCALLQIFLSLYRLLLIIVFAFPSTTAIARGQRPIFRSSVFAIMAIAQSESFCDVPFYCF